MSLYGESCINYTGVCKQYLPHVKLNNSTSLSTLTHNEISETNVTNFMNMLKKTDNLFSKKCAVTEVVLPFLCQYTYPPCIGNEISAAQIISRKQCENIRDMACSTEWRIVTAISPSLSSLLPVCENFDEDDDFDYTNNSQDTLQPLQCHYQFKEFCGLCLPLCGKFSQYKAKTKLQERSVLILSGITAFIGGILVFIAAFIRRKQM